MEGCVIVPNTLISSRVVQSPRGGRIPTSSPRVRRALFFTLAAVLGLTPYAAAQTWDGARANDAWTTANNWSPNGVPANIVMAGTKRLTPRVVVDWDIDSLVFSATEGGFSISGHGVGVAGVRHELAVSGPPRAAGRRPTGAAPLSGAVRGRRHAGGRLERPPSR